jgi:hypothetical protein
MPGSRPKHTNAVSWSGCVDTLPDPAISTERMALTNQENIRCRLKTPYRDGTTHIVLEPPDFIARLAALMPKLRVNLNRFHGVFVRGGLPPNSKLRKQLTPKAREQGYSINDEIKSPAQRHTARTSARWLKRVFNIDIAYLDVGKGRVQDAVAL